MIKTKQDAYSIHTSPRALAKADAPTLLSLFTLLQSEFYGCKQDLEEEVRLVEQLEDSFLFSFLLAKELQTALEVVTNRNRAKQITVDAQRRTVIAFHEFRHLTGDRTPNDFIEVPPLEEVENA